MAFSLPASVVYTKTTNGNLVTITSQVQDSKGVNIGPATTQTIDSTQVSPLLAFKGIVQSALREVQLNLAWSDVPASGTLQIPIVDTIDDGSY